MKIILILIIGLFSFSSFGSRHFWKFSKDPGSLHFWKNGRDVGSQYFWLNGKHPGSQHFWKYGRKLGSEYFWKYAKEPGSLYFWKYGKGPGSHHYWKHGDGPGSKQFWDYGHSASFFPYFVAVCKADALDIPPCEVMDEENLQETLDSFMSISHGPNAPINLIPPHIYENDSNKEQAPSSRSRKTQSASTHQ